RALRRARTLVCGARAAHHPRRNRVAAARSSLSRGRVVRGRFGSKRDKGLRHRSLAAFTERLPRDLELFQLRRFPGPTRQDPLPPRPQSKAQAAAHAQWLGAGGGAHVDCDLGAMPDRRRQRHRSRSAAALLEAGQDRTRLTAAPARRAARGRTAAGGGAAGFLHRFGAGARSAFGAPTLAARATLARPPAALLAVRLL